MTEYVLSLSYGKDSLACLGAIEKLGLPLDRIIHAEVWATDDIPADPPAMVEFKKKADAIIKNRWGIEVEHLAASRNGEKLSYEKQFYTVRFNKKTKTNCIYGFPITRGAWCNSRLKMQPLNALQKSQRANVVQYLGIAVDEPERIARHTREDIRLPLVEAGWDEAYARQWCEENDLLSPIYTDSARGGCWFCHNQGLDQLRLLRKNYPEYWDKLLAWDSDSPVTFHSDGHTVHDYDKRFKYEDLGLVPTDKRFRWKMLENYT